MVKYLSIASAWIHTSVPLCRHCVEDTDSSPSAMRVAPAMSMRIVSQIMVISPFGVVNAKRHSDGLSQSAS